MLLTRNRVFGRIALRVWQILRLKFAALVRVAILSHDGLVNMVRAVESCQALGLLADLILRAHIVSKLAFFFVLLYDHLYLLITL